MPTSMNLTNPVDREGTFRAKVTNYGLYEAESGAIGVQLAVLLLQRFDRDNREWQEWEQYGQEAEGTMWIVKKDGSLNNSAIESLVRCTGWDGNLDSIYNRTWEPTTCQVVIREDEYDSMLRYRVAFVNEYDAVPGGTNITPDRMAKLRESYGMQMRAAAANVLQHLRGGAAYTAKSETSKKRTSTTATNTSNRNSNQASQTSQITNVDDIPF